MRIQEENRNIVLLSGVCLVSALIAGAATVLEPTSGVNKSRPVYLAHAAATSSTAERKPAQPAEPIAVRVIGAPFLPNTNPRQR